MNSEGVGERCRRCGPMGARLVHMSTDLVFDGAKGEPYTRGRHAESTRRLRPLEAGGRAPRPGAASRGARGAHVTARRPRATRAPGAGGARGRARGARCRVLRRRMALGRPRRGSRRGTARACRPRASGILHVAGAEPVNRYELACMIAVAHGLPTSPAAARDHRGVRSRAGSEHRPRLGLRPAPMPRASDRTRPGSAG